MSIKCQCGALMVPEIQGSSAVYCPSCNQNSVMLRADDKVALLLSREHLESENARLRAALEFYADEATWAAKETENPGTPSTWCPERGLVLGTSASTTISPMHVASEDRGERARAALGGSDG